MAHMRFSEPEGPGTLAGVGTGGDEEMSPGVEADGVGGMSSSTCRSPGESRWCGERVRVAPREGRQWQRGCWVTPSGIWGDKGGEGGCKEGG